MVMTPCPAWDQTTLQPIVLSAPLYWQVAANDQTYPRCFDTDSTHHGKLFWVVSWPTLGTLWSSSTITGCLAILSLTIRYPLANIQRNQHLTIGY